MSIIWIGLGLIAFIAVLSVIYTLLKRFFTFVFTFFLRYGLAVLILLILFGAVLKDAEHKKMSKFYAPFKIGPDSVLGKDLRKKRDRWIEHSDSLLEQGISMVPNIGKH